MTEMTRDDWKSFVDQWRKAAPELETVHREALEHYVYDWAKVESLLDLGTRFAQSRPSSGLVDMQYWFSKDRHALV